MTYYTVTDDNILELVTVLLANKVTLNNDILSTTAEGFVRATSNVGYKVNTLFIEANWHLAYGDEGNITIDYAKASTEALLFLTRTEKASIKTNQPGATSTREE